MKTMLNKREVDNEALQIEGVYVPETLDREKRTVEAIASTGAKGLRSPWWGDDYYEELEVSEAAIRLGRFNNGAPLLKNHWAYVEDTHGVIERSWVQGGELRVLIRFASDEDSDKIFQKVADGILRKFSVGYRVYKYQDVSEDDDKIPTYRAIDWEPFELSVVAVAFDDQASTRSDERGKAPKNKCVLEIKARSIESASDSANPDKKETPMDEKELQRKATEAEKKRVADVKAAVRNMNFAPEIARALEDRLIDGDFTIESARQEILDEVVKQQATAPTERQLPAVEMVSDEGDKKRDAVKAALSYRAISNDAHRAEVDKLGARHLAGRSLIEVARMLIPNGDKLSNTEVVERSLNSSSDFPNIISSISGAALNNGFGTQTRLFTKFCTKGELRDFKPSKRVMLTGNLLPEEVAESGAIKSGTYGDKGELIQLLTYAKKFGFTRQMFINDELNVFAQQLSRIGANAALLENILVFNIFNNNPKMADDITLFHANHGNLGTGASISETSAQAMENAFASQTDLAKKNAQKIGVFPKFLIVPTARKFEAKKILTAITPASSSDVNPVAGEYELIVSPFLNGANNPWYGAGDPNLFPTIEYSYLDGQEGPTITQAVDFDTDGMMVKLVHDFAVKALDPRNLYKNPGA